MTIYFVLAGSTGGSNLAGSGETAIFGVIQQQVDRILPFFDPPPLRGQFLYPERGQKQTFLTPSPPHLVHVIIECFLTINHFVLDTLYLSY